MRYRLPAHATILRDGRATRVDYRENDCCCARFALVDEWLEAEGRQRRGPLGHGEARLARARDVVAVVTARLSADELAFLEQPELDRRVDPRRRPPLRSVV